MIRQAVAADAERLSRIAHQAYAPYTEAIGRLPAPALQDFPAAIAAGQVWVSGAPPVAYAVAFEKDGAWFLENLAVAPDNQGHGLSRSMISHIEDAGRRRGFDRITLYTNAKMTANLALYPTLGYRQTGRRIEDGFDRVYFEKRL
ncbi:MAG: GNAT family N-acetyltransferase [Pseudomonadota bacterium]